MARRQVALGGTGAAERAWWLPREGDAGPSPLLSLRLLGLHSRGADAAVSFAVVPVEHTFARARVTGPVVVADRTLAAFADLERGLRPFRGTVVSDHQIEGGETALKQAPQATPAAAGG